MEDKIARERRATTIQSVAILGGMVGLFAFLGLKLLGGGVVFIVLLAGGLFMLLRRRTPSTWMFTSGAAVPLAYAQAPELHRIVERLSQAAGLDHIPQLGYMRSPVANALSVGTPESSAIVVTDGLIRTLPPRELAGVLAHELSHIKNNDLRILSISDTLRRLTGLFSHLGVMLLVFGLPFLLFTGAMLPSGLLLAIFAAPFGSLLLHLALSRSREFSADLGAARITGDPEGLASALARIESVQYSVFDRLFGRREDERSVFRSHPPTRERINRLLNLRNDARRRAIRYT